LSSPKQKSYGIAGKIECVESSITIVLKQNHEKYEVALPLLVSSDDSCPIILGRKNFFDNFKIAIEIETGKSDFLWNIQQDLAARYDKIIVVATDKSAFEKIEKELAQAGLLIAGRVELVQRDNFSFVNAHQQTQS
jgi:hypothetical protein